ncbi:MAG TPA: glycosyltransferase family 2 protein [Methylibium sp.]|uniref:glycosyltransferase family 2 protein n=1 Tax=Methylibium sp. TaxID=2067992 RepID=UPI002DB797A2|nr:glycosyltransferase family 2 protein [Methylibium sp.]HEU4459259.1 glycosyltransferase family 2 protein [Methylibium sp.]
MSARRDVQDGASARREGPAATRANRDVRVVIVNYRTAKLAIDCLASLADEVAQRPGTRVVVVDNASGDGSAEAIAQAIGERGWSAWAGVLPSAVNGGFAYGNNLAVRAALAEPEPPAWFWMLNPDTRVDPGALGALVDFAEAHAEVGIVGSALENDDGSAWPYAFRFPTVWSEFEGGARFGPLSRLLRSRSVLRPMGDRPVAVDWMPGASMMVRREVFDAIGLMDEGYFLYYEETDFFLQAHRAGWQSWYVPASRVMHIAGASTGVTGEKVMKKRMPAYWFESRRRYFVKNHGRAYAMLVDAAWLVAHLSWRARRALQRKPDTDPPRLAADFVSHSALLHGGLPGNAALTAAGAPARGR